jgi:hypothetical protein
MASISAPGRRVCTPPRSTGDAAIATCRRVGSVRPGRSGQIRRSPSVGRGPGAGERHPVGRTGGGAPPRLHRLSALQGRGLRAGGGEPSRHGPAGRRADNVVNHRTEDVAEAVLAIGGGVRAVLPAATLIGTAMAEKRCRSGPGRPESRIASVSVPRRRVRRVRAGGEVRRVRRSAVSQPRRWPGPTTSGGVAS